MPHPAGGIQPRHSINGGRVQHSVLVTVIQRALNENLDLDAALA